MNNGTLAQPGMNTGPSQDGVAASQPTLGDAGSTPAGAVVHET